MFKAPIWCLQNDCVHRELFQHAPCEKSLEQHLLHAKNPVMKDSIDCCIIWSWDIATGQEVELDLTDGWFSLHIICWGVPRPCLISQVGKTRDEKRPGFLKPASLQTGFLVFPNQETPQMHSLVKHWQADFILGFILIIWNMRCVLFLLNGHISVTDDNLQLLLKHHIEQTRKEAKRFHRQRGQHLI